MANGLLSPVEQQTQAVFGMVPMQERLSILPRYSSKQGMIAPQFLYELAKAVSTPIVAMRGQKVSPEEALNVAISTFGGSAAGVAPKGSVRSGLQRTEKGVKKTEFEIANEIAQRNATEMLGLPPNNTAMDRAKALGFDMSGFHATGSDFRKIDPEMVAKSDYGTIGQGFYIDPSKTAGYSNLVAKINQAKYPQNIMPVMFKSGNLYDMTGMIGPTSAEGSKRLTANMKDAGFSGTFTYSPNGSINEVAVFDPSIVRSRFAAFDPARVNEADLLAMGGSPLPLGLLASDNKQKKQEKKPKK
jgi:hypothetical protein